MSGRHWDPTSAPAHSLSPLITLNEAYKMAQLRGFPLSAHHAFYLATLGSARAIYQDEGVGSIEAGKHADPAFLDFKATTLVAERQNYASTLEEQLFILMTLGDERVVKATYGRQQGARAHCMKEAALEAAT